MKKTVLILATIATAALLTGCGAGYDRFAQTTERSYAVTYDADSKSGALSVTFKPASAQAPNPAYATDDQFIEKLARLVYAQARKNDPGATPDLSLPVAELPKVEGK